VPEAYGGLGLGMVEATALMEEMGRASLPGPYFSTVFMAGTAIDAAGSEAQKKKYLTGIADGSKKATLALLEKNGSWDPDTWTMQGGSPLTGEKWFVTDAAVADFLVVATRGGLYVVDANASGLSIELMPSMDMTRKLYKVAFHATPAEELAAGPKARAALDKSMQMATAALTAEMAGGMQRVMEMSVEYVKTRKQFGKPIGQYQAVQHQCADMLLMTECTRSAAIYAGWALTEGAPDAAAAVSVAKSYASDAYREVGNKGVQVQGGMGFTWENDVHLFYRRAKASEIAFGDGNYHREKLAKLVVDPLD
jgi:alkylation response protein AidB-like acyl-CoA dehydrogenase